MALPVATHVPVLIGVEEVHGRVELFIGQDKPLACRRTVWEIWEKAEHDEQQYRLIRLEAWIGTISE